MRRTNHRNLVNVGILSGRIPLISLVQFIAVAEHLNFRHAAKALGISQSSVSARVKALEDAGLQWRIAVETPNLATLKAAVGAGLGVTCRTHLFLEETQALEHDRLPPLPRVAAILRSGDKLDKAANRLAELARETVEAL